MTRQRLLVKILKLNIFEQKGNNKIFDEIIDLVGSVWQKVWKLKICEIKDEVTLEQAGYSARGGGGYN